MTYGSPLARALWPGPSGSEGWKYGEMDERTNVEQTEGQISPAFYRKLLLWGTALFKR